MQLRGWKAVHNLHQHLLYRTTGAWQKFTTLSQPTEKLEYDFFSAYLKADKKCSRHLTVYRHRELQESPSLSNCRARPWTARCCRSCFGGRMNIMVIKTQTKRVSHAKWICHMRITVVGQTRTQLRLILRQKPESFISHWTVTKCNGSNSVVFPLLPNEMPGILEFSTWQRIKNDG